MREWTTLSYYLAWAAASYMNRFAQPVMDELAGRFPGFDGYRHSIMKLIRELDTAFLEAESGDRRFLSKAADLIVSAQAVVFDLLDAMSSLANDLSGDERFFLNLRMDAMRHELLYTLMHCAWCFQAACTDGGVWLAQFHPNCWRSAVHPRGFGALDARSVEALSWALGTRWCRAPVQPFRPGTALVSDVATVDIVGTDTSGFSPDHVFAWSENTLLSAIHNYQFQAKRTTPIIAFWKHMFGERQVCSLKV